MRSAWGLIVCLLSLLLVSPVRAQVAAPSFPTTAPAAPAAPTVWGSMTTCCTGIKTAICNGPLGTLLKNALKPLCALTGNNGPLPPSAAAQNAPGAAGAAAKIQADQAAAKQRVLAVRFLGTVDCHWYPEAEAGLVAALRADKSECVRFEAAKSLARGCCCTKTTIEALSICVEGSEKDGNPSENSLRVQLVALEGLQRCVTSYRGEALEPPLPRPEQPASQNSELLQAGEVAELPPIQLSAYYNMVKKANRDDVLTNAKRVVSTAQARVVALPEAPRGRRSVMEIWQRTE